MALTGRLTAAAVREGRRAWEELRKLFDVDAEVASECGDLSEMLCVYPAESAAQPVVFVGWRNQPRLPIAALSAVQRGLTRPILLTP